MVKFLKPNNAVIVKFVTQGRYDGLKAVVAQSFDNGTHNCLYARYAVVGISKYPKNVIRKDSSKKTAKKSHVKAFIKVVNYNG